MAALPMAKYGISNLFLFPYYSSREQYLKATGQEPPAFDITKPPKYWFDPSAKDGSQTRRNVVYENVVARDERGLPISGTDGRPMVESMTLLRSEASVANIPYKIGANEPGTERAEIPPPMRALDADEYLDYDFGQIVIVRNRKFDEPEQTFFNVQDRELIRAIARKLGVSF